MYQVCNSPKPHSSVGKSWAQERDQLVSLQYRADTQSVKSDHSNRQRQNNVEHLVIFGVNNVQILLQIYPNEWLQAKHVSGCKTSPCFPLRGSSEWTWLLIGRKASVAELLSMVKPLLSIEPLLSAEPLLANFYLLSLHNTAIHFRRLPSSNKLFGK